MGYASSIVVHCSAEASGSRAVTVLGEVVKIVDRLVWIEVEVILADREI